MIDDTNLYNIYSFHIHGTLLHDIYLYNANLHIASIKTKPVCEVLNQKQK